MSLQWRLLSVFVLFFLVTGISGATVMALDAHDAVRAEMTSALVSAAAVVNRTPGAGAGTINDLGLRHVLAVDDEEQLPVNRRLMMRWGTKFAPQWFEEIIGVEPITLRVTRAGGGETVILVAVPWDEVTEVWNDMVSLGSAAVMLSVGMLAVLALAVARTLRPLVEFERGLDRLIAGDYTVPHAGVRVPELARIAARIENLAAALSLAQAENRRLGRTLVSVQDRERREVARELHDDLGAGLFGIKVDAARIAALAGEDSEIARRGNGIVAGIDALHQLGRRLLTRLRPPLLDQLPLGEALSELVASVQRQQPALRCTCDFAAGIDDLDDAVALTVYRLVQEGLTNARRHGEPSRIHAAVRVDRQAGVATVTVTDDGRGLTARAGTGGGHAGLGLAGMAERVHALGGTLTVGPADDGGGTQLRADIPLGGEEG